MKRTMLIFALLASFAGAAFAQNRTSLNIICNQVGAQVLIDGKLAGYTTPNFSFLISAGNRTITVKKDGFQPFQQTIKVSNSPVTLNVTLVPIGGAVTPPPQTLKHVLTVNCNVNGAQVIINNIQAGVTPFRSDLAPGSYSLIVRAPGYTDYTQNVVINGNTTINAVLQGQMAPVSLSVNVPDAEILFNNASYGKAANGVFRTSLAPGNYRLEVRSPGYNFWAMDVIVNPGSGLTMNVSLQQQMAAITLTCNRDGAAVYLNGNFAGNITPPRFVTNVVPGVYNLTVKAPGFSDYNAQINVPAGTGYTANIVLQYATASYHFTLNPANINPDFKGNPWSQIRLYIDGGPQKDFEGQLLPGRRVIRVVTGALVLETAVDVVSGANYTFELGATLTVK